jgi:hypothetical protein
MAEFAIFASFEVYFKWVVYIVLVAEDLLVHVDAAVVDART